MSGQQKQQAAPVGEAWYNGVGSHIPATGCWRSWRWIFSFFLMLWQKITHLNNKYWCWSFVGLINPGDDWKMMEVQLKLRRRMSVNGKWCPDWAQGTSTCWSRPTLHWSPYRKKWLNHDKDFSYTTLAGGREASQGSGLDGRHFQSRRKLHLGPRDRNNVRTASKDTLKYFRALSRMPLFQFRLLSKQTLTEIF